jgi:hypothetical protein
VPPQVALNFPDGGFFHGTAPDSQEDRMKVDYSQTTVHISCISIFFSYLRE